MALNNHAGQHVVHNRGLDFNNLGQVQNTLLKYIGKPSSEFSPNNVTEDQWGVADSLIKKWGGAMEIVKSTIVQSAMEISPINTHVLPLKHAHALKLQMPIRTISRPMMQQTAERAPYRKIVTSMQYVVEELDRHAIGFDIGTEVLVDSPLGQQEYADKMNATVEALRFAMEHSGLVQLVNQQSYESAFPITRPVQNKQSRFYDYMMAQIGTYAAIAKGNNGFEFLSAAAQKVGKSLSADYDTVVMSAGSRQLERAINPTTRKITVNNCKEMVKLGTVEDQQTIEINMIGSLHYIEHQPVWDDISKSLSECPLTRISATASSFPLTIEETDDDIHIAPIQITDLCTHSRVTMTSEMLEDHVWKSFGVKNAVKYNRVDKNDLNKAVSDQIVTTGTTNLDDKAIEVVLTGVDYTNHDRLAAVDSAIESMYPGGNKLTKQTLQNIYAQVSKNNCGYPENYVITYADLKRWAGAVDATDGPLFAARKAAFQVEFLKFATKSDIVEWPLVDAGSADYSETAADVLRRYNRHYRPMLIRPYQSLLTSAMIFCKGGGAVGNTWFHMSMFKIGNDAGEGVHTVEGLAYYKTWVSNPRGVLVMGDVVPAGIVSGCGHKFIQTGDAWNTYSPLEAIDKQDTYGDVYIMWVLKNTDTNLPICLSSDGLQKCSDEQTFRVANHLNDYMLDEKHNDGNRAMHTTRTIYYPGPRGEMRLFVGSSFDDRPFEPPSDATNSRGWNHQGKKDPMYDTIHFHLKVFGVQQFAMVGDITGPSDDTSTEARVPHFAFPGTCWTFIKEQGIFKLFQRNSGHLGTLDMPNASRALRGMFEASVVEEA